MDLKNIDKIYTEEYEDIGYPIGSSNSSATYIAELKGDEDAKQFLTHAGVGPDLDDPELINIAEYSVSVEPELDCCTKEFMEKFGFSSKDLEQDDDCYHHRSESERMIAEMLVYENNLPELINYNVIDKENPFYGISCNIRYSQLCDMYEEFILKKKEWDIAENQTMERF